MLSYNVKTREPSEFRHATPKTWVIWHISNILSMCGSVHVIMLVLNYICKIYIEIEKNNNEQTVTKQQVLNHLSSNPTKRPNTLKQFLGILGKLTNFI